MNKKKKNGISLGAIILFLIIVVAVIVVCIKLNKKGNSGELSEQDVQANFRIKDIKCNKGQEINVEIELLNDSNFVAANFEYKYDSTNLEYLSYEVRRIN